MDKGGVPLTCFSITGAHQSADGQHMSPQYVFFILTGRFGVMLPAELMQLPLNGYIIYQYRPCFIRIFPRPSGPQACTPALARS